MKKICVYCGSSSGSRPDYLEHARKLGKLLANRNLGLVYGGSNIGLMGALADEVLQAGGHVTGVIPEFLVEKEVAHRKLSDQRVVTSMHERKMLMVELADGFVALPGGLGTLEELFEALTWAQLGLHKKPCALLNVAGYFDHLVAFLEQTVKQEFVSAAHLNMVIVENNPETLLDQMQAYVPPTVEKLIRRNET